MLGCKVSWDAKCSREQIDFGSKVFISHLRNSFVRTSDVRYMGTDCIGSSVYFMYLWIQYR